MLQQKEVRDLIATLRLAKGDSVENWGRAVFLIGAGCSRSAGIPMADGVAKLCVVELVKRYSAGKEEKQDPKEALKWLCEKEYFAKHWFVDEPKWSELYGEIFEEHLRAPNQQRDMILTAIDLGGNKINWVHVCLGDLVKQGYIHTVITTNFDQLVLQGIINTGVLPVVADGLESSSRVTNHPRKPQVVHLHGSAYTYALRNSRGATEETENEFAYVGMIHTLLQDCGVLVVVGYSGGEEGLMKLLIKSAQNFPDLVIYWINYGDLNQLSKRAEDLLNLGRNKFVIPNQDADKFFQEIVEGLELGLPEWIQNPINTLLAKSEGFFQPENPDIQTQDIIAKIKDFKDKIHQLNECWESNINKTQNILNNIINLRLEGNFEQALLLLKETEKLDYEMWRMEAETAYEAGQRSSNVEYLLTSKSAWETALLFELDSTQRYLSHLGLAKTLHLLSDILPDEEEFIPKVIKEYQSSLTDEFKENQPQEWAEANNNLGKALQNLNELTENPILLKQAVEAHKSALEIYSRDSNPEDWAETQSNLGGVLQTLGELESDPKLMHQSISIFEEVLEIYGQTGSLIDYAETQSNLGWSLYMLGELTTDISLLERSVVAYNKAIEEYSKIGGDDWASTMIDLGSVLQLMGELQKNIARFKESQAVLEKALDFFVGKEGAEKDLIEEIKSNLNYIKEKINELK
ncbi:MAG TPA: SIR2 family protein [Pyrinomonadaceae bacterium]|jgi:tetratricopeptide (TPR) repeat protein